MEVNNNSASKDNSLNQAITDSDSQPNKEIAPQKKLAKSKKQDNGLSSEKNEIKKSSAKNTSIAKPEIIKPKDEKIKKTAVVKFGSNKIESEPKSRTQKKSVIDKQPLVEEQPTATEDQINTNDVSINQEATLQKEEKQLPGNDNQTEISINEEINAEPEQRVEVSNNDNEEKQFETVAQPAALPHLPNEEKQALKEQTSLRKITFQIKFHTNVGQSLFVIGNYSLLGNNAPESAFPLSYLNDEYWSGSLEIPADQPLSENISYNYILKNNDNTVTVEWGADKIIEPLKYKTKEFLLIDSWNASSFIENTFYTEPFQNVLLKNNYTKIDDKEPALITHVFRVKTPLLDKGQTLCIIGSISELGNWDTANPVLLSKKEDEVWYAASLDLSNSAFPITYKYGVFDINTKKFLRYEDGQNRWLNNHTLPEKLTIVSDGFAVLPSNGFKGAGVAIPVFSLRSEKSFGTGEFNDLKLLVDWAKQIGLKLIQILPVNDTTATHKFTDSYPYAAISAYALHPLYLHLPSLLSDKNDPLLLSFEEKGKEFNKETTVDYVGVMAAKWSFIKQIFPSRKQQVFESDDFKDFFEENTHWLVPYAAFCYFREKYNTPDFNQWPENITFNADDINKIASSPSEADDEISIYYYVQFHLHLQLKNATEYAHKNGIILKGDIPIGIYRFSCDAWQEPLLFNMNMQAGAPPDDFAVKGQNWGFPTYNWQQMRKDGFTWWKNRFKQMSYYFDAFRIDHILGFFRIWSIPMNAVEGIMGHFVPAIPIYENELFERRISFDMKRITKPFIHEIILSEIFGSDKEDVIQQFLKASSSANYTLKPEFDNQRKVEAHFALLEDTAQNRKIKTGLFDLISNVILFEEEGSDGKEFHFRIAMENTSSFRFLDGYMQYHLKELYLNYFYRRQDNFWQKEAMLKLPALKRSTNMLICGEDLGMVPDCVPGVMKDLAILSLEIQRMPKDPKREFFHPNDAPYLSVVTPSTHDMSTIRGWWEENRASTQHFFNSQLGQWGTAPYFCEPWINKIIIVQHLYSPAMWSIFQLQDLLGIDGQLRREKPNDERINIPADPRHYWRYRMHLTLESLIKESDFTAELSTYIKQSGR